jgi:hypothetical protein
MLNLLDRIGGAMFAAAWPLSAIGFYGTGAILFPGSVTVVYVAVVWFFAYPFVVSIFLTLDD